MARTPAASIKRLQTLEAPSAVSAQRVMCTRQMTLQEWERLAVPMQEALLAASAQDRQEAVEQRK